MKLLKSIWITTVCSLLMVAFTPEVEAVKLSGSKKQTTMTGAKKLKAKYSHKKGDKNQLRKDAAKKAGRMVF